MYIALTRETYNDQCQTVRLQFESRIDNCRSILRLNNLVSDVKPTVWYLFKKYKMSIFLDEIELQCYKTSVHLIITVNYCQKYLYCCYLFFHPIGSYKLVGSP